MFLIGNVMCFPDKNKPWMTTCIARREWFPPYARYFMGRGVPIMRDFINSRLRNIVTGLEFFGHWGLLVVYGRTSICIIVLTCANVSQHAAAIRTY